MKYSSDLLWFSIYSDEYSRNSLSGFDGCYSNFVDISLCILDCLLQVF